MTRDNKNARTTETRVFPLCHQRWRVRPFERKLSRSPHLPRRRSPPAPKASLGLARPLQVYPAQLCLQGYSQAQQWRRLVTSPAVILRFPEQPWRSPYFRCLSFSLREDHPMASRCHGSPAFQRRVLGAGRPLPADPCVPVKVAAGPSWPLPPELTAGGRTRRVPPEVRQETPLGFNPPLPGKQLCELGPGFRASPWTDAPPTRGCGS